jgi:hypothetical protein
MERISVSLAYLAFSAFCLFLDIARPDWAGLSPAWYLALAGISAGIGALLFAFIAAFFWVGYVIWRTGDRRVSQYPRDVLFLIDGGETASVRDRFAFACSLASAAMLILPALRLLA